jgi:hypothetical protein
VLTGCLFTVLTDMRGKSFEPGKIYSSDLAGSALGFIATAGIIIPLLGIQKAVLLLSAMIFAGLLFGTIRNK